MTVKFYKYQGTGNDFIMIDNRNGALGNNPRLIRHLCNRHFGIGADGLIYLENLPGYDFKMVYFNSDGNESSMCGNGGRCLIRFAAQLGVVHSSCRFMAIDGEHTGQIHSNGIITLKMKDVDAIETYSTDFVLNTGSPHYVRFTGDVKSINLVAEARSIRYSERFSEKGINVNFVQQLDKGKISVRTYERGVEDETLSCGTGVVASALAFVSSLAGHSLEKISVETPGGSLEVTFRREGSAFKDIYLTGPAEKVFEGEINTGSLIK